MSTHSCLLLSSCEGDELRRSVLIRNAVKAATTFAKSSSVSIKQDFHNKQVIRERWIMMASQSGLHPCDYTEEDEEESLDYTQQDVQMQDYYHGGIHEDPIQDEEEWFQGLLEEVRAKPDNAYLEEGEEDEDEEERQTCISSITSLPSLMVDDEDDTSEEEEEEEAIEESKIDYRQQITNKKHHHL